MKSVVATTFGALLALGAGTASAGDEVEPAPRSIGADVPLTWLGTPPSSVTPELIGPHQLLKSGTIDMEAGTITLPLYHGTMTDGREVWYVVTDTTDEASAAALGLNFSSKLRYADTCRGARTATLEAGGMLVFDRGTVDFSPERMVEAGSPAAFPPADFAAGSVGDEFYSPLVKITNQADVIYNAPIIAFDAGAEDLDFCAGSVDHALVHDKVTAICPSDGTVTMQLTLGHSFAKPVFYLATDANEPMPAALESATYAPALRDVAVGEADSLFSPVGRLFVVTNGAMGVDHPQRQGLESAILGEGGPLNVLGGIPTVANDYSPLWNVSIGEWTVDAISKGYRSRMTEEFQFLGMVERNFVTGPGGEAFGSSGFVVNASVVHRFL